MSADTYVPISKALSLVSIDRKRLGAAIKNGTVATIPNEHDRRCKLVKLSDIEKLQLKRCRRCKKRKSILLFHHEKLGRNGYAAICKTCKNAQTKRSSRIRRYGLSDAHLAQLREEANGKCMLCGKKPTDKKGLHIDHDHSTGMVRGLICNPCNLFIWAVNESPEHARFLASQLPAYLERTPTGTGLARPRRRLNRLDWKHRASDL